MQKCFSYRDKKIVNFNLRAGNRSVLLKRTRLFSFISFDLADQDLTCCNMFFVSAHNYLLSPLENKLVFRRVYSNLDYEPIRKKFCILLVFCTLSFALNMSTSLGKRIC